MKSPETLAALAKLVALEESTYRNGSKNSYFAGRFGIDVLTDTTERSPTFCTPPFRKFDDDAAAESWAFLFLPEEWTDQAWQEILKRKPRCVEWREPEIRELVAEQNVEPTLETIRKISPTELMRYKIGSNGIRCRMLVVADCAIAVMAAAEKPAARKFLLKQLGLARAGNVNTALIYFGQEMPADMLAAAECIGFGPRAADRFAPRWRDARGGEAGLQRAFDLHDGAAGARDGQHHDLGRAQQPEAH